MKKELAWKRGLGGWRASNFELLPEEARKEVEEVVERIRERSMTQAKAYGHLKERFVAMGLQESVLPSTGSFNRHVRRELGLAHRTDAASTASERDSVFTDATSEKLTSALGVSGYISLEAFIRTLIATKSQ